MANCVYMATEPGMPIQFLYKPSKPRAPTLEQPTYIPPNTQSDSTTFAGKMKMARGRSSQPQEPEIDSETSWTHQICPGPADLGVQRLQWVHNNYRHELPRAMFERDGEIHDTCHGCAVLSDMMTALDAIAQRVKQGSPADEARLEALGVFGDSRLEFYTLMRGGNGGTHLPGQYRAAVRQSLAESMNINITDIENGEAEFWKTVQEEAKKVYLRKQKK
ncbi:MAG: hypothetical protein M1828_002172 [Chrysothrix sp. TS-e1954]|nr:MAG: hypothetical protein M1828_002172 [Chrysothrix sp. TS-e1954]